MSGDHLHGADVCLRPMEVRDAAEVSLLIAQLSYERSVEQVLGWIAELGGRADRQAAFVAWATEEVVGWISLSIERPLQGEPFALIGGLVVKDGLRGQGIGRRLCEQAELWGRTLGVTKMRVASRSTRPGAHRFYLQDGYEPVKTSMVFEKRL